MLCRRAFNEIVSGVSNRTHSATITLSLDENEFKKRVDSSYVSLSRRSLKLFLRVEEKPDSCKLDQNSSHSMDISAPRDFGMKRDCTILGCLP